MPRSTAKFLAYDLRPAKQTERRILLDYLEALKESGVQISSARYIGMGGTKFYDFAMAHRYLGVKELVSCEWNATMAKRGKFNRPFARIGVLNQRVGSYLRDKLHEKMAICWLDYDNALNDEIVEDIGLIGSRAVLDSSFFVTVAAEMPESYLEMTEAERLDDLRDIFSPFASNVTLSDVEESAFPNAVAKIIEKAFHSSFSGRNDGAWLPYFQLDYKDSMRMLTFGGTFLERAKRRSLRKVLARRLPFLVPLRKSAYRVRSYNLTERERHLFEFSASARTNSSEARILRDLGFSEADLTGYRELVRFLPRYIEAYL